MSVKVIVTDMDGTFLNDAKTYNQPRFMAQYQELKKRGIKFVVTSAIMGVGAVRRLSAINFLS